MKIIRYVLGQLQANCYFLVEGDTCLIVDPADEAGFILEELQIKRLKLTALLATHGHFDHIMAVGEIQSSSKAPLFINSKDRFLVDRLVETAEYFLGFKPAILPIKKIENIENKNSTCLRKLVNTGNFKMKTIYVPGHTPGSVLYYFPNEKAAFTGDTLFKGAVGRYDFSYCNKKDLGRSLQKILELPEDTKVFPGHGEETTVGQEKKNINQSLNLLISKSPNLS